ncbi:hypothetical protein WICPIJ_000104 [Wickerhamomyces pijperi]|uniref:Uncharacterized protein n=1 Tax=Wickerhamomyces pijperi TaxID=599730 RepID=A0A9P8QEN7_WICPI|nr:hypothetical protein WICPIJ_000104 [Wickerhamomyces pijperi]
MVIESNVAVSPVVVDVEVADCGTIVDLGDSVRLEGLPASPSDSASASFWSFISCSLPVSFSSLAEFLLAIICLCWASIDLEIRNVVFILALNGGNPGEIHFIAKEPISVVSGDVDNVLVVVAVVGLERFKLAGRGLFLRSLDEEIVGGVSFSLTDSISCYQLTVLIILERKACKFD